MLRVSELRKMGGASQGGGSKPGQYSGTVTRADPDGTTWVRFDGGESDTPCTATMSCSPGDRVTVDVEGGRAYIPGNETVPATGDGKALEALAASRRATQAATTASRMAESATKDATTANRAAAQAVSDAATARGAAEGAQADAATAALAAEGAVDSAASAARSASEAAEDAALASDSAESAASAASSAASSAQSASRSAETALRELATVQDVAGVLEWITRHGTMASAAGTQFDASAVYFVADQDGDYAVGGASYSIVEEPAPDDLASYYTLSVDSSIENYVNAHLVLTGEGLWLLTGDSGGYRVLVATGGGSTYTTPGTYVIDGSGNAVASFSAAGVVFSEDTAFAIGDSDAYVRFDGDGHISIVGNVTIGSAVQFRGHRRFAALPAAPYDGGDLWDMTDPTWADAASISWGFAGRLTWGALDDGGALLRCVSSRESGAFGEHDWEPVGEYSSAEGVSGASKTATSYVTDLSDGMMVHPAGDSASGWRIASAIELLKSGASYIKAWLDGAAAKVRVGLESAGHAVLSPDGMEVYRGSESVASFGSAARVGPAGSGNVKIDSDSVDICDGEDVVATFGTSSVSIGRWAPGSKAGDTAEVSFYDGSARIEFEAGSTRDRLKLDAGAIVLSAYDGVFATKSAGTGGYTEKAVLVSPDVLWSTPTTGDVKLSKSAAGYNHMRIYYARSSTGDASSPCGSVDVHSPDGKYVNLVLACATGNSTWPIQLCMATVLVSGDSVKKQNHGYANLGSGTSSSMTANYIYITRVEAWNE